MKASQIASAVNVLVSARQPVFVWGEPGIGKSDVMCQVAACRTVQLLDVRFVDVDLRQRGRDLGERQHAHLLALEDQALDFFEFLQIHN